MEIIIDLSLNLIFTIISFSILLIKLLWYLQVLQILEYFNIKFLRWIKRNYKSVFLVDFIIPILIFLNLIHFIFWNNNIFLVSTTKIFSITFLIISFFQNYKLYLKRKVHSKKGLVFTKRLNRILILNIFVILTIIFLTFKFLSYKNLLFIILPTFIFFEPLITLFLNLSILPLEKVVINFYFNDAIKKIEKINPFIIAITGSFGKTSTKFYINQFLKERMNVFMTPESYNTAMGITKVIRNDLKEKNKIFVVELAENEVGGFKRLFKLIKPNISVVTSVGIQHLEEFGKEERILKEIDYFIKYSIERNDCELIVLNGDNEFLSKYEDKKIVKCSIDKISDFSGEIIETNIFGSKFYIYYKDKKIFCETKIIGKESIRNIIIASCIALYLGFSLDEISEIIKKLEPPPHRLNVLNRGNILVIDDAYNSNPIGSRMAIDILSTYKNGRKIIVTPGLIELGKREYEENKNLGKYMIDKVDYVFLVGGKRVKPIFEGLIENGFDKEKIFINKNFSEALEKLKSFLKPDDAVLFENDLPEIYEEI